MKKTILDYECKFKDFLFLVQTNNQENVTSIKVIPDRGRTSLNTKHLLQYSPWNPADKNNTTEDPTALGEKPYSCSLCTFRTAYQGNLTSHQRTHTGERPYPCPHCPARFARKSHLDQHLSTHTGAKPYACPYCSYRSSRISYLRRHQETHTR